MTELLKEYPSGKKLYCLKNDSIILSLSNFGCTLQSLLVKDREGNWQDVVLGYEDMEEYDRKDTAYLGAVVGRVCNRIARGQFCLNGKDYQLFINNGPNSLHGGEIGFSYRLFETELQEDRIVFSYHSPDGEENFPGNLDLKVIYELRDQGFAIRYEAISDQDTLINLTNHSYFNLSGKPEYIGEHLLRVAADRFGCVDENTLYNGLQRKVEDSPFDFRKEKRIADCLQAEDAQLTIARGLDHSFVFCTQKDQITLYSPKSGIEMTLSTTLPQAQIYSANWLEGKKGKHGYALDPQSAICLETQFQPDAIHWEKKPSVILKKGEKYQQETLYRFALRNGEE